MASAERFLTTDETIVGIVSVVAPLRVTRSVGRAFVPSPSTGNIRRHGRLPVTLPALVLVFATVLGAHTLLLLVTILLVDLPPLLVPLLAIDALLLVLVAFAILPFGVLAFIPFKRLLFLVVVVVLVVAVVGVMILAPTRLSFPSTTTMLFNIPRSSILVLIPGAGF